MHLTERHSKTVFLDEGALNGDARFPSACAVVVDDVDAVRSQIDSSIHKLTLRPEFRLEATPKNLRDVGFHHADDNHLAKRTFIDLLPRLDFEWWCSSNLHAPTDPYTTLSNQFEWLVERILQKNKKTLTPVNFIFEQNPRLNSEFSRVLDRALTSSKYPASMASLAISGKQEHLLAIADYCIAISSQAIKVWRKACCDISGLHKNYQYRDFAAIELKCSVLDAWEMPRSLSTRPSRLLQGRTYFQLSGVHHPSCSR